MNLQISWVLMTAIFTVATITALIVLLPTIEKYKDAVFFYQVKNKFVELNENVEKIISEGENSTRTIEIEINKGKIIVDKENNTIEFQMKSEAEIISGEREIVKNMNISSSKKGSVYTLKIKVYYENVDITNSLVIEEGVHNIVLKNQGKENKKILMNVKVE